MLVTGSIRSSGRGEQTSQVPGPAQSCGCWQTGLETGLQPRSEVRSGDRHKARSGLSRQRVPLASLAWVPPRPFGVIRTLTAGTGLVPRSSGSSYCRMVTLKSEFILVIVRVRSRGSVPLPANSHHQALRSSVLAPQTLFLAGKTIFPPCLFPSTRPEMQNANPGVVCPCTLLSLPKCMSLHVSASK